MTVIMIGIGGTGVSVLNTLHRQLDNYHSGHMEALAMLDMQEQTVPDHKENLLDGFRIALMEALAMFDMQEQTVPDYEENLQSYADVQNYVAAEYRAFLENLFGRRSSENRNWMHSYRTPRIQVEKMYIRRNALKETVCDWSEYRKQYWAQSFRKANSRLPVALIVPLHNRFHLIRRPTADHADIFRLLRKKCANSIFWFPEIPESVKRNLWLYKNSLWNPSYFLFQDSIQRISGLRIRRRTRPISRKTRNRKLQSLYPCNTAPWFLPYHRILQPSVLPPQPAKAFG